MEASVNSSTQYTRKKGSVFQSKREGTIEFLKNIRNSAKGSKQSCEDPEIRVFETKVVPQLCVVPGRTELSENEPSYVEIACENGIAVFHLPLLVAFQSGWIERLFVSSKAQYKENQSQSISFPDFTAESMELVLGWMNMNMKWNPTIYVPQQSEINLHTNDINISKSSDPNNSNSNRRISFQFPLPQHLVMDILSISYFLEIEQLVDFCLAMLTEYVDDVPNMESIPRELVWKILQRLDALMLHRVEHRRDVKQHKFDTSSLWKILCENKLYSLDKKLLCCSWQRIFGTSNLNNTAIPINNNNNNNNNNNSSSSTANNEISYKILYWQTHTQDMLRSIASEDQFHSILALLHEQQQQQQKQLRVEGENGDFVLQNEIQLEDERIAFFIREHSFVPLWLDYNLQLYIHAFTHLTAIEISSFQFSKERLEHLCNFVSTHPSINTLKLSHSHISHIHPLSTLLQSNKTNIALLDLSGVVFQEFPATASTSSPPKYKRREETMKEEEITSNAILSLSLALSFNTHLTHLSLCNTHLNSTHATTIITELPNWSVEWLDLGENSIYAAQVKNWASLKASKLKTLLLGGNNCLCHHQNMPAPQRNSINNLIENFPPTLTALDLSACSLMDFHIRSLRDVLLAAQFDPHSFRLSTISLNNNNLSDESAVALAELLTSCPSITSLDISSNRITDGIVHMGQALKTNSTLLYLDLSRNGIKDKPALLFAKLVAQNTLSALQYIDFNMNSIANVDDLLAMMQIAHTGLQAPNNRNYNVRH